MTEVKICGLTRPEDVDLACELGADYVGFNFAADSPRRVSLETASDLASATRPGPLRVGVFVSESHSVIREAVDAARLDLIQIHRAISEQDVRGSVRPVIAVARVSPSGAEIPSDELLARCRSLLLDTATSDRDGGTGVTFDWTVLERRRWPLTIFIAGGLNPGNVGDAIARLRPAAVDVASGVEQAPGIKDRERMKRFFAAVRESDGNV